MSYEVLFMLILRNSSHSCFLQEKFNIAKKNARYCRAKYFIACHVYSCANMMDWDIMKTTDTRTCMVLSTFVLHIIEVLNKIYCFSFENATTNSCLYQCCSGLCIDLLRMLSKDVGFDYELFEVDDEKWGAFDKVRTTEKLISLKIDSNICN